DARDERRAGAVEDAAEDVAAVAVQAHEVLRPVGRAREAVGLEEALGPRQHRHVGDPVDAQVEAGLGPGAEALGGDEHLPLAVGGDDRGEQGDEQQQAEDDAPGDGRALAERLAQRLPPQAAALELQRRLGVARLLLAEGDLLDGHQLTRTFGSRNVYTMSVIRLMTTKPTATTSVKPWTTK